MPVQNVPLAHYLLVSTHRNGLGMDVLSMESMPSLLILPASMCHDCK